MKLFILFIFYHRDFKICGKLKTFDLYDQKLNLKKRLEISIFSGLNTIIYQNHIFLECYY